MKSKHPLKWIEIFSKNILHNIDVYQKALPKQHFFPVLKSNAYGHGIECMTKILKNFKTPYICVNSYFEAEKIWKVHKRQVLIFGADDPKNYTHYDFSRVAITIFDIKSLRTLSQIKKQKTIRIHLFINTGMNREGISPSKISEYIKIFQKCPHLKLEGVMSHLADADNPDHTHVKKQERAFSKCLDYIFEHVAPKYVHLGNSAGATKVTDPRINAYRVGISLYGYNQLLPEDPFFKNIKNLKPALRLKAKIINIIDLKKGDTVSYNCTFIAPQDMRIGVIPIGYYEALDRKLSEVGHFSVDIQGTETYLPILGRVCMNLTAFDIKSMNLSIGDEITIFSEKISTKNSVAEVAKLTGTISYEICTRIAESIERVVL